MTGSSAQSSSKKAIEEESDIVTVDLIFWSDGFTIGDGPLRPLADPESLSLMERIRNG